MSKSIMHFGIGNDGPIIKKLDNTVICGAGGTGKTTLIKNIVANMLTLNKDDTIEVIIPNCYDDYYNEYLGNIRMLNYSKEDIEQSIIKRIKEELQGLVRDMLNVNDAKSDVELKYLVYVFDNLDFVNSMSPELTSVLASALYFSDLLKITFIISVDKIDESNLDLFRKFKHIILLHNTEDAISAVTKSKEPTTTEFYESRSARLVTGVGTKDGETFTFNDSIDRMSFDLETFLKRFN